jgi:hypothetical protein
MVLDMSIGREKIGGRNTRPVETPRMIKVRVQRVQEILRDTRILTARITEKDPEEVVSEPAQDMQLTSLTERFSTAVVTYGHEALGLNNTPELDIEPYTIAADTKAA